MTHIIYSKYVVWGFWPPSRLFTNQPFFFLYNRLWNGTDLRSSVYTWRRNSPARTVRDDDADSSFGLADPHRRSGRLQNFADKFFTFFFFKKRTERKSTTHTTFNGMKFIKHFFLTSTLFIPCCCCSVGQTWHPYRDPPLVTKEQKSTNNNILFGVFDAVL